MPRLFGRFSGSSEGDKGVREISDYAPIYREFLRVLKAWEQDNEFLDRLDMKEIESAAESAANGADFMNRLKQCLLADPLHRALKEQHTKFSIIGRKVPKQVKYLHLASIYAMDTQLAYEQACAFLWASGHVEKYRHAFVSGVPMLPSIEGKMQEKTNELHYQMERLHNSHSSISHELGIDVYNDWIE